MADTEASSSSAVDPATGVPVLLSISYLEGGNEGQINYHYLFPPPPFWVMSQHGWRVFEVIDWSLLEADEWEEKERILDMDIGEVLYLVEESLMDYYGDEAEDVGLGLNACIAFVTDYNAVEVGLYFFHLLLFYITQFCCALASKCLSPADRLRVLVLPSEN